jgi:hypothetical protein
MIDAKAVQPEKAEFPIVVTLFGIVIDVKAVQLAKTLFPIVVMLLGNSNITAVKPEPLKAEFPIVVTLFGMVRLKFEVALLNPAFLIRVTGKELKLLGIIVLFAISPKRPETSYPSVSFIYV